MHLAFLKSNFGASVHWWFDDMMIWRYDDMKTWRCGDMTVWWYEAVEIIPPGKRTPSIWWKFFGNPRFWPNPRIFGRTDLRISLSRAKFDVEADFDVRSAVDRPKPRQISEKRKLWSENFADFFFGVKGRNVQNRPKRVLAKFRADPSHVRAVTKKFSPQSADGN